MQEYISHNISTRNYLITELQTLGHTKDDTYGNAPISKPILLDKIPTDSCNQDPDPSSSHKFNQLIESDIVGNRVPYARADTISSKL